MTGKLKYQRAAPSKFDWLKDYRAIEEKIKLLEFKIARTKKWLQHPNCPEEEKLALAEYEWDLAHEMDELHDLEKIIKSFNGLDQKILVKKYVEGKTLSNIAGELGYSYAHIKNRHATLRWAVGYNEQMRGNT